MQSTQRVYKTFLALDEDMNGLLSMEEFGAISNGTMSPFFISERGARAGGMYVSSRVGEGMCRCVARQGVVCVAAKRSRFDQAAQPA